MRILITGGAGFIGSAVVRFLLDRTDCEVLNIDSLTYAAYPKWAEMQRPRYHFRRVDVRDAAAIGEVFSSFRPNAVMHLAAETHVDRSIDGPASFLETNVFGTFTLLEAAVAYWLQLDEAGRRTFRFHHVSTDEVFGDLAEHEAPFSETHAYRPSSPYSASKAASDHLVRAWHRTYNLPVVISNCSNNYGPWQFPEKLIPLMILNAIEGRSLPVYGDGRQIRDWLHVEDHAEALYEVLTRGRPGETYNVGARCERRNIDVVRSICSILEDERPQKPGGVGSYTSLITLATDRPGHDRRYAIDDRKIRSELGWSPRHSFEEGLRETVRWYLSNLDWCESIRRERYDRQRIGIARAVEKSASRVT